MNWGRIIIAGLVAGIVVWLANYVLHAVIMASTYVQYSEAFSQEPANPIWFAVISVCIAIAVAILFAKTCDCWAAGVSGGITFGFFVGLAAFFSNFYYPLIIGGFPYFLAWCWGGINIIQGMIGGAVIGALYKKA